MDREKTLEAIAEVMRRISDLPVTVHETSPWTEIQITDGRRSAFYWVGFTEDGRLIFGAASNPGDKTPDTIDLGVKDRIALWQYHAFDDLLAFLRTLKVSVIPCKEYRVEAFIKEVEASR
tara:strand:+ start:1854 stop:2213 length:360 start_codon:yes stop_codon:yes gene_type:complete